jgi:hypothetical protein
VRVVFAPTFPFPEPIAVTIRDGSTERTMTRWLVAEQQSPVMAATGWLDALPAPAGDDAGGLTKLLGRLTEYAAVGFNHIVPGGYDHLLFVLGLYLGTAALGRLVGLLAMYTLAHSVTLAMATLGWVSVPAALVEPIIALSIAWIGIENWLGRGGAGSRYGVVFGFGLVHGLGFAGALGDMGLPGDALLAALAGFNVGVELGQLAFVAVLWMLLGLFRHHDWYRQRVVLPASTAISVLALFWTAQRVADGIGVGAV